jgi:hypothetical protein
LISSTGTFTCPDGGQGTYTDTSRVVDGQYLISEYRARETSGTGGCVVVGRRGGYRQ